MVRDQIVRRGITDKKVVEALLKVKRHVFVPSGSEMSAYEDHPLPIGYDQTISQPFIVAYMTQALQLDGDDKVLEIGTGSGYQAAILAEIVKEVYTIEIVKELAASASQRLKSLGYDNIHVKHGDGFAGWPQHAPFDAIIVTAAPAEVPQELLEELKVGGRMVIPMGTTDQELFLITKTSNGYDQKTLLPVRFVPMIKEK
ncbi:MAG: protein-L-isoaspartate O-methyltransferase [Omnitrophica WOR_2 bacterium GWA2_47_8]|nr:MAG: protein-L-isoaspartate O-methyltransferase [Omnitrophica WOR_2 bacterium GWA2_47_8]